MMGMLILGHRGSSKRAPENTLRSFQYAFEEGADGIELDVFLSKDGHLVVTHDENLKTLIGINVWTRRLNLSELKKLDFGDGEKIPTLDEFFENFGQKFKIINVEIKSTGIFSDGVEKIPVDLISTLMILNFWPKFSKNSSKVGIFSPSPKSSFLSSLRFKRLVHTLMPIKVFKFSSWVTTR